MTAGKTWTGPGYFAAVAALIGFLAHPHGATADDRIVDHEAPIRLNEVLTASQRVSERWTYRFEAIADRHYLIEVSQGGLDWIVSIDGGNLHGALTFNSPLKRDGSEYVVFTPSTTASYRIVIHTDEWTGTTGYHAIRITELDELRDEDELAAWRLMSEAAALNAVGDEENSGRSATVYATARRHWAILERPVEAALAKYSEAFVEYYWNANWDATIKLASDAATTFGASGQKALQANACQLLAAALTEKASAADATPKNENEATSDELFVQARNALDTARAIHDELGNAYDAALTANKTGYLYFNRGDHDEARRWYSEAATMLGDIEEWSAELEALGNRAILDAQAGLLTDAIAVHQRQVDLLEESGNRVRLARALDLLASANRWFGNLDTALKHYAAALELQLEVGDDHGAQDSLLGTGQTYFAIGDFDIASDFLRRALDIAKNTGDGFIRAATRTYLGNIAYSRGMYTEAYTFHKQAIDDWSSANSKTSLRILTARDLRALGRYDEAAEELQASLELAQEFDWPFEQANARAELGRLKLNRNDLSGAEKELRAALGFYERYDLRALEAEALFKLSLTAARRDDRKLAVDYGLRSLERVESLRTNVADPELRAVFSGKHRSFYDHQIALLMANDGSPAERQTASTRAAFDISERSRARMLTELLDEAQVNLDRSVGSIDFAQRERLLGSLAQRRYHRDSLLSNSDIDEVKLNAVLSDMREIEHQLNLLETRTREADTGNPITSEALSLTEIQALLDPDSALLQFALADDVSFAWLVTNDSLIGVELAGREAIESIARDVYDNLKAFNPAQSRQAKLDRDLQRLATFVIEPVADLLDRRRLLVSADGALQYIPFGILPLKSGNVPTLIERFEVVSVPSMSVVSRLRNRTPAPESESVKSLLAFADPVFSMDDPRLLDRSESRGATVRAASNDVSTGSGLNALNLRRLPYTGREVEEIASLLPEGAATIRTGLDATVTALETMDLTKYAYLHFATHGLVDSRYPALSALAFSRTADMTTPGDSLLRLSDIFGLRLNADLVVLSACETALGRHIRGEGLIGLTQGFLYAGTRSVLVSLWQVPDRATAELMTRFYEQLFSGSPPSDALRLAQRSMAKERRWRDPYFWAAIVVVGDWI